MREPLQRDGRAPEVGDPLYLAREPHHFLRSQHLAWARESTEPGRNVEDLPTVTRFQRRGLADIQSDPHPQGQGVVRLPNGEILKLKGSAHRLPGRWEHGERLVTAQFEHVPPARFRHLAGQGGKSGYQLSRSRVTPFVGK